MREGVEAHQARGNGPLKDPTIKNIGVADKRRTEGDGEEQKERDEGMESQRIREDALERERPEEREVDAWSESSEDVEMDGIREAVAEAIQEAGEQAVAEGPTQRTAREVSTSEGTTSTSAQAVRP